MDEQQFGDGITPHKLDLWEAWYMPDPQDEFTSQCYVTDKAMVELIRLARIGLSARRV